MWDMQFNCALATLRFEWTQSDVRCFFQVGCVAHRGALGKIRHLVAVNHLGKLRLNRDIGPTFPFVNYLNGVEAWARSPTRGRPDLPGRWEVVTGPGMCRSREWEAQRPTARYAANVLPVIREIQASGVKSLRGVARALAARGIATARGGAWTPVQISATLHRVGDPRFARKRREIADGLCRMG
jgi:hypothetical protein